MFRWLRRMLCGIPEEQVARFCAGRTARSDGKFLIDSGLPRGPEDDRVAVAVRRAVANVGAVDPQYIRPDDTYPDELAVLPLWDSMDWLAFVWELEGELGTRFSDAEIGRLYTRFSDAEIGRLFNPARVSVKEMIEGVQRVLAGRASAGPESGRSGFPA